MGRAVDRAVGGEGLLLLLLLLLLEGAAAGGRVQP